MDERQKPARKVVVVTGASAGVGRATAVAFAREGASIGLLAREPQRLEHTREEVERAGGNAFVCPVDVADAGRVDDAATTVEESLGAIDVWVNNAMATVFAPFAEITPEEYRRATEVTYLGYVWGTMAALRRMGSRDRGVIVQVGSALAYRAIPLQAPYCGAKHAIQGFTESVRSELVHNGSNVRLTTVHLPALNTPQFDWARSKLPFKPQPVPPIYEPEVAAEAIVWAASSDRREVWVGGPTVVAILMDKIAPALGDLYLGWAGYGSQQTEEPANSDQRDNLFEPVPGDPGAHGRFGDRARRRSLQLWATRNRRWLAAGGLAAVTAGAARFAR